jgi:hypothetical protein
MSSDPVKAQLARQVAHWVCAATELADLSRLASRSGWSSLEHYLGITVERALRESANRLAREASLLEATLRAAETPAQLERLRGDLLAFRERFLSVETVLDFYGDAINTRTDQRVGAYLRACDLLATRAMEQVLVPLGKRPAPVLTYLDRGLGASILKAGLRLWDGRVVSPVAAIKIVRHNLLRPTSLLHEAGHQVAHDLGYNDELAQLLARALAPRGAALSQLWSSWASEIAADVFAFAHTGYAAVAALHDVLAGDPDWVLRHVPGDPHPVGYLRILLGQAMCVRFFGHGPWDDLARAWIRSYPESQVAPAFGELVRRSRDLLPEITELLFFAPLRCFGGRCVAEVIDPGRVKPEALDELERRAGASLQVSDYWLDRECLRLVALSGMRAAVSDDVRAVLRRQEQWMLRLGEIVAVTRVTSRATRERQGYST